MQEIKEIYEEDLLKDLSNGLKCYLYKNNYWYFADDVLKDLNQNKRNYYINYEVDNQNKMIVKIHNKHTIMIKSIFDHNKISKRRINPQNISLDNIKFIYALETHDHIIKIGISNNFCKRRNTLAALCGKRFINEYTTNLCLNPYQVEAIIKQTLKEYKVAGEWFEIDFNTAKKTINQIFKQYAQI